MEVARHAIRQSAHSNSTATAATPGNPRQVPATGRYDVTAGRRRFHRGGRPPRCASGQTCNKAGAARRGSQANACSERESGRSGASGARGDRVVIHSSTTSGPETHQTQGPRTAGLSHSSTKQYWRGWNTFRINPITSRWPFALASDRSRHAGSSARSRCLRRVVQRDFREYVVCKAVLEARRLSGKHQCPL